MYEFSSSIILALFRFVWSLVYSFFLYSICQLDGCVEYREYYS